MGNTAGLLIEFTYLGKKQKGIIRYSEQEKEIKEKGKSKILMVSDGLVPLTKPVENGKKIVQKPLYTLLDKSKYKVIGFID